MLKSKIFSFIFVWQFRNLVGGLMSPPYKMVLR